MNEFDFDALLADATAEERERQEFREQFEALEQSAELALELYFPGRSFSFDPDKQRLLYHSLRDATYEALLEIYADNPDMAPLYDEINEKVDRYVDSTIFHQHIRVITAMLHVHGHNQRLAAGEPTDELDTDFKKQQMAKALIRDDEHPDGEMMNFYRAYIPGESLDFEDENDAHYIIEQLSTDKAEEERNQRFELFNLNARDILNCLELTSEEVDEILLKVFIAYYVSHENQARAQAAVDECGRDKSIPRPLTEQLYTLLVKYFPPQV